MNPYDFVRIDWARPPERRRPIWHHRLISQEGQQLYSGRLAVDIYAETPLFIADSRSGLPDPRKAVQSIKDGQGAYIIPGSSLKGMLRNVVETLGNGCLTLFDGSYERRQVNYGRAVPEVFLHCSDNTNLCIACRIFGMLKEHSQGVYLGKVAISDAYAYPEKTYLYAPIYTRQLMEPKPHHASFYLDEARQYIAGRKYYFHHSAEMDPVTRNGLVYMGGKPANRHIQPLSYSTQFHVRIDFTNLEPDEFAALLLAITLEDRMRHKIGYGKPLGLGSVYLFPTRLTLIDYAARYTQANKERGMAVYEGDSLWTVIDGPLDEFYQKHLLQSALVDLRRIWRWPPDPTVDYYYPDKHKWFDTSASIGKRIADTRNVP